MLGLSAQIARVIREVRPDAIFAPDPWLAYESHLDHAVTGRAAANAFLMSGRAAIPGGGDTQPHAASAIGYYFTAQPNTVVDISAVFEKKFEAIALHDSQMDAQTLAMYRVYFGMKGKEQAAGKNFALGEG
ncbi:MAG: PIG-L deacetylase family protein [Ruthenibacterium lactatiformans]